MYVCNIYTYIYVNICIWRWTPGEETDVTAPELSCRSRTEFRHSRSRSRAVARGCKKIILLEIWRQNWIRSDSSGAGTRMSKSGMWTAALERERRLRHLAFTVIYTLCIYSTYIYIYMYMPSISHAEKPTCTYICIYIMYICYIITYISYIVYLYIYINKYLYICLLLAVQKTYKYVKS